LEIQEEIFVIDIFCFHLVSDVLCWFVCFV
jgi:hypothetical protein